MNSTEYEFIILINDKMPTIVGILTFNSMINTTSESLKEEKKSMCFNILNFMRNQVKNEISFITWRHEFHSDFVNSVTVQTLRSCASLKSTIQ